MISALWERLDPSFREPVWLLVGFLAIIAVVLLEIGAHRRRRQAVRLFAASHLASALTVSVSPLRRLIKAIFLVAAVGLFFVALARPCLFFAWQEENRSGVDILIAVDCSKSMLTQDVKPSRIERAKLAIADFADRVPDNRLGLIAFAGDAFLQCPLTLDHDAFQNAVEYLNTDTIPRPGTDLASAIDLAIHALKSQPNNLKFLILVTDGEDLEGRALDRAKAAAQAGLKIYTIGVGTAEGDRIQERDESGAISYHQDGGGQDVVSKLDESTLRQMASLTGGDYAALGQSGEGLNEIYNRYIAPIPKTGVQERREKIHLEQFEWPLAAATLLLMLEFMIKDRATERSVIPASPGNARRSPFRRRARVAASVAPAVIFVLILFIMAAPSRAADADVAERDYQSGKYEDAMEHYQKAAQGDPARNDLQFNRGDAAYKAGDYSEAEDAFRQALETPDLGLQEDAYYNLGNAEFQHGQAMEKVDSKKTMKLWEDALHSYDSALKLKDTSDSRHNYAYVKEKLEELKKQRQSQGGQDQQDQSDSGDQGQSPQDGSQGKSGQGSPQNQAGQNGAQGNGQASQQAQPGDKNDPQSSTRPNGQAGSMPKDGKDGTDQNMKTYSGTRAQDLKDPNIKSKQDAENLLDSLKDDERHITARSLNDNEQVSPPASGKDW